MLTIELKIGSHILETSSNLFDTYVFLVSILEATPTRLPLKYKCSIKLSSQSWYFYLSKSKVRLYHFPHNI